MAHREVIVDITGTRNERYILAIAADHQTVRVIDQKPDRRMAFTFTGPHALYDALGLLADWRDRDART